MWAAKSVFKQKYGTWSFVSQAHVVTSNYITYHLFHFTLQQNPTGILTLFFPYCPGILQKFYQQGRN